MSFSSELKEWGVAAKELWQEENRKHPYARWFFYALAFFYALREGLRHLQ